MQGRGREFWKALVDEVGGGARVADVARRHRVQPKTLAWWRWRLRSEPASAPLLLPVVLRTAPPAAIPDHIELHVCDVIVRVAVGTDVTYVATLVASLRAGC